MAEQLAANAEVPQAYDFTNIVVLWNPKSKNIALADERYGQLEDLFPGEGRVSKLETHKDLEVTRRIIIDRLAAELSVGNRPVLAIAGGDGTVNTAIQTITSPALALPHGVSGDDIRTVPIVPLGTGNANDLAYMLYEDPTDLAKIFTQGKSVDIRPLVVTVQPGKQGADRAVQRRIAGCYTSFGATAEGARVFNEDTVRKYSQSDEVYLRHLPDFFAVAAAVQAVPFGIEHDDKRQQVLEILFGNGDRAAKRGRMPARLDKPELFVAKVAARHKMIGGFVLFRSMFQMMRNKLPGKLLTAGEAYTFKVLDTVPAQCDGETWYARATSTITVSHSELSFRALTTKLRAV
jgi:diacylglycerol kinase family enzyme